MTINDLVDVYEESREEHLWIKAKLADLEDRSRRNNVKLCSILEMVQMCDPHIYARDMMSALVTVVSAIELTINSIHFIPKPEHLARYCTNDTIWHKPRIFSFADCLTVSALGFYSSIPPFTAMPMQSQSCPLMPGV